MKTKTHKILIVDDDKDILELLKYNLEKEGYQVCAERESAKSVDTASRFLPDLIILDIMMPQVNGLDICSQLRARELFRDTYIFFLTAKSEKYLQFEAFRRGGDDYIEKITGLRALSHKVGSVLKKDLIIRKSISEITLKSMRIERKSSAVIYNGRQIPLSKDEFELLFFFAQNPKKIISRDSILHNIWGSDIYLFAKSVDSYVNNICSKLGTSIISTVCEGRYRLDLMAIK